MFSQINFEVKNMILTYTKDFSWKKNELSSTDFKYIYIYTQIAYILKLPDFYDKFQ